nr:MAG TPA: hypothetical protein [Caudoviricetes sp.]DAQ24957.1 MAG TPA: hypothetical protein [Caudoviricetes sp.]
MARPACSLTQAYPSSGFKSAAASGQAASTHVL